MLNVCNFKFYEKSGHTLCTKKFLVTSDSNIGRISITNQLFLCDGECMCTDFLVYKNTELILAKINAGKK